MPSESLPTRRLTTILAADVAGYSRLTAADEEGTLSRLRDLRRTLVDPTIAAYRGRIVKTAGDGLLLEFSSVVDAARCAVTVQRDMAIRNADFVAAKRIEFRVGIHLGDVMVESDGDLMGDGVNIAARLEGICAPGQIYLSRAAFDQIDGKIDVAVADLGERELKNIARPVRVYAIGPPVSPSPPRGGGEGRDEVGDARASATTSPSRAVGAGPSLSATRRGDETPPRLSIVVLPFANIGGDPEQNYFVDGVTESLTTDLSRISGSFVIARNTAFTYKDKPIDVKQIGRDLKVRYVLEGSVQKGRNRLRVNVQLIEAESAAHLWAERFDKPVADLFDMQDEIVARLARQLDTELIAAEARRAERAPRPDSMDLYFQGAACWHKGAGNPENMRTARGFFEEALALDPTNVEALVGKAWIDTFVAAAVMSDERAARIAAAESGIGQALALAPNHAFAHFVLSWIYTVTGRGAQGIAEAERSATLDRNLASAHYAIGFAKTVLGRPEETEAHVLEALRLSPHDSLAHAWMAVAAYGKLALEQYEAAEVWVRRSIEANRTVPLMYFFMAATLALQSKLEEATAAAKQGLALDPRFTLSRMRGAFAGDPTAPYRVRLVEGLRLAGVPEG